MGANLPVIILFVSECPLGFLRKQRPKVCLVVYFTERPHEKELRCSSKGGKARVPFFRIVFVNEVI